MSARHTPKVRPLWLCSVLALSLACAAPLSAEEPKQVVVRASDGNPIELYRKSFALVIGNSDYRGLWPTLINAAEDAKRVKEALQTQGFEVRDLYDLSIDQLETALKNFFLEAGQDPEARLLVWFAGHGYTISTGPGQPARGYIVATGAPNPKSVPTNQRPRAELDLKRNALSMDRFAEYMKEATSKHVLMVFDSCFAGTVFSGVRAAPSPAITRATGLPARQFITSGTANQTVLDDGRFQRLFLSAISGKEQGADPNNDGYVTATELGVFLSDKVTNLTRSRQTPVSGYLHEAGFDGGDFVFVAAESNLAISNRNAAATNAEEEIVWRFVRDWNSLAGLQRFLAQYPNGANYKLAEAQIELIKTPQVNSSGPPPAEPTISRPTANQGFALVKVFYATNRKMEKSGFGSDPAQELTLGTSRVSMPATHKPGMIERPATLVKPDPKSHIAIVQSTPLQSEEFSKQIKAVASQGGKDALIYVHGWNTSFDDATYRATQLAYDMDFAGPVILFSWPAKGGLPGYALDIDRAEASTPHLNNLLSLTRKAVGPNAKVHIATHGIGIKPVLHAVQTVTTTPSDGLAGIGEIIAAAPDMAAADFDARCAAIKPRVRGITVYASPSDKALQVSEKLTMARRAGQIAGDGPALTGCADVIAIGTEDIFSLNHDVYASSKGALLQDVRRLVEPGARQPPPLRSADIVSVQGRNSAYWRFK